MSYSITGVACNTLKDSYDGLLSLYLYSKILEMCAKTVQVSTHLSICLKICDMHSWDLHLFQ